MHYIFFAAFLYIAGDFISKLYSISNCKLELILAVLFYFLASIFMVFSVKENSLSVSVLLIDSSIVVSSVLIGRFYFNETLSIIQILGAILIFLGIFFILFGPYVWK